MKEATFKLYGSEYILRTGTAICCAELGDESRRQEVVIVETDFHGEKFVNVVFGWPMPKSLDEFRAMAEDSSAWESDQEVLETIRD